MNTEEIIRTLTRIKDSINFEVTDSQKKVDALNAAIQKFKQEPCIENYVPMSVIMDIKTEIKSLMKEQETHFDVLEVGANRAFLRTLNIINMHILKGVIK